jgi:hypothetical protein
MTDDRDRRSELAERLLAEDGAGPAAGAVRGSARGADAALQALIEDEQATERRVRRVATWSWGALLALVPLIGVLFLLRRLGGGLMVEVARAAAIVVGILFILALFLAVLTTVAWLFRSRTASLAAIERRLAALEELLRRSR